MTWFVLTWALTLLTLPLHMDMTMAPWLLPSPSGWIPARSRIGAPGRAPKHSSSLLGTLRASKHVAAEMRLGMAA